jgi:hypothetical protein
MNKNKDKKKTLALVAGFAMIVGGVAMFGSGIKDVVKGRNKSGDIPQDPR